MQAFDDLLTPFQPVQKVAIKHAVAAVLGQVQHQLALVDLVADQFHIVDEPSEQLVLRFLINRMDFFLFALDIQCLHLLHDLLDIVHVADLSRLIRLAPSLVSLVHHPRGAFHAWW